MMKKEAKLKSRGFSIKRRRICTSFGYKPKMPTYKDLILETFEWAVRMVVEETE